MQLLYNLSIRYQQSNEQHVLIATDRVVPTSSKTRGTRPSDNLHHHLTTLSLSLSARRRSRRPRRRRCPRIESSHISRLEDGIQLSNHQRFPQEPIEPLFLHAQLSSRRIRIRSERDDKRRVLLVQILFSFRNLHPRRMTVHQRHLEVHQDQVVPLRFGSRDGL
jgi:hypothetical protein